MDQLGSTQLTIGGVIAPVFSAQSEQIAVQVPWQIASQTSTEVAVAYTHARSGILLNQRSFDFEHCSFVGAKSCGHDRRRFGRSCSDFNLIAGSYMVD